MPPDSVRITNINGNELSSTIGPYVLGMTLVLKCIATGGEFTITATDYEASETEHCKLGTRRISLEKAHK